jgi:uncharacterized membrane protein YbaN (DUF454 family)
MHRSIPRRVKRWVYLMVALSFGSSIFIVSVAWLKLMLAVLAIVLTIFIWRIPVRDRTEAS